MRFSKLIVLLAVVFFLVKCKAPKKEKQALDNKKPNFILIYTDDQRYNTIHALGNEIIQTPNMDFLVNEGATFTHAYNMGAWHGAVCVASRSMLITGLSVWNARRIEPQLNNMISEGRLWPQRLEEAGYETYMAGKWHIKAKVADAFDHVTHVRPGMVNQTPQGYNRPQSPRDTLWQPWDPRFGGYWKGGKHWSEVLADDAIHYIHEAEKKEAPFFMYIAFNAPHDPRQSPKEYVDKYPVEDIPLPESYLELYPYKDSIGCGPGLRDEKLAPFPRTPYAVKKHIQEYYALITHLDDQIGRIMETLKESGKIDNTYIIFTSDHGLAVGNHGLMGKQNMFDHSMRVPLVIVGPGITKGQKLSQQVYLQDIMPTTLELAGVAKDSSVEFHSLLPYINNQRQESVYPSIYGCYMDLQRMVRNDRYKLIVYPRVPKILLFDLDEDPEEKRDLSGLPAYAEIRSALFEELLRQQKALHDPLDLSPYFPEIAGI